MENKILNFCGIVDEKSLKYKKDCIIAMIKQQLSISDLPEKEKFDMIMDVADKLGIKTKEYLIRGLVCDGEPADESCIGHPVLFLDSLYMGKWHERQLEGFDKNNLPFSKTLHDEFFIWEFAKKKPGYDYTQEVK